MVPKFEHITHIDERMSREKSRLFFVVSFCIKSSTENASIMDIQKATSLRVAQCYDILREEIAGGYYGVFETREEVCQREF